MEPEARSPSEAEMEVARALAWEEMGLRGPLIWNLFLTY